MTDRQRRNLELLRDKMATVPPEKFDMAYYVCDTTCCIAGWAGTIPEIQEQGLILDGWGLSYHEGSCVHPAAIELFGVHEDLLFYDFSIKTPEDAVNLITELLK